MLDAPVEGHSGQGEDAGVHGEEDDEVHDLAHHRTEHPLIQGVDGGLERHAEDDEAQIRDPEVEDEQVGGLGVHLTVPEQNREHQRVPHGAHQEDEREAQRDDHRLRSPGGRVQRGGEIHPDGLTRSDVCPTLTLGDARLACAQRFHIQTQRRAAGWAM